MQRYAYGWITSAFFIISIFGHWIPGWFAYADDAIQHGKPLRHGEQTVGIMAADSRT